MLAELRSRSQITIPAEIIKHLGIFLCPVVIYPKEKLMALAKLLKKADIDAENKKEFTSVEDMFADMGIDLDV